MFSATSRLVIGIPIPMGGVTSLSSQSVHSTWKRPSARRLSTGACVFDREGSGTAEQGTPGEGDFAVRVKQSPECGPAPVTYLPASLRNPDAAGGWCDHNLQSTHRTDQPTWTRRSFSPRGDRWRRERSAMRPSASEESRVALHLVVA
jgi:hypothetical protein